MSSSISTPPMAITPLPRLTLIVATTPSLGLGFRGTLPWPPLKVDLAFFARITKRPPASTSANLYSNGSSSSSSPHVRNTINAVVMGRKTWTSIPAKFRPLKGRINVVVSRQIGELQGTNGQWVMQVGSIAEGLRRLQQGHWERNGHATAQRDSSECDQQAQFSLGRVFIIGGAEIYATALKMDCCERILWTRIEKEYECDVWFPKLTLGAGEDEKDEGVWQKKKERDLDEWCGEVGVGERKEEGGIGFRVEMWEKLTPDSELG